MTTREATQHPNLKALGTTLILLGGPAVYEWCRLLDPMAASLVAPSHGICNPQQWFL